MVGLAVPSSAHAGVLYSAVADFSGTTNSAASVWSYRSKGTSTRDGSYPLLGTYADISDPVSPGPKPKVWNPSMVGAPPWVGVNTTGINQSFTTFPVTWPAGDLFVHPSFGGLVVVSWLAPAAGTADIAFSFADADPFGGDGINWYVERNDQSATLASGTIPNGGPPTGLLSVIGVGIAAGDRINFVVDRRGGFAFDSTRLTATIDFTPLVTVPAPGAWAVWVVTASGLVAARRRHVRRA